LFARSVTARRLATDRNRSYNMPGVLPRSLLRPCVMSLLVEYLND
jgi:hypothetical protein